MKTEPLACAAALAAKRGVGLGRLAAGERDVALALAAAALPHGQACTEPQATAALRQWLAGPGGWLDIDAVELRRTLVDRGLWQRDGYGRDYRRVAAAALESPLAQRVSALDAQPDLGNWLSERRAAAQRLREARRRAWEQRGGVAP